MVTDLRSRSEQDLGRSLEGEWGAPVVLIDPDGVTYDELRGQVLTDTTVLNPDTGDTLVLDNPIVTLRRSSLARVPVAGEKWVVKIPLSPVPGSPLVDHVIDPTRSLEGGRAIGFIRIYLRRAVQS